MAVPGNLPAMLRLLQVTDEIDELKEKGQELLETAKANPALLKILIVIGVFTAVLFFWGVARQALKAAVIGGLLSVGAWYWYFNIR